MFLISYVQFFRSFNFKYEWGYEFSKVTVASVVIYEGLYFDLAQGQMNGAPNETRTHSCRFASLTCKPLHHQRCPTVASVMIIIYFQWQLVVLFPVFFLFRVEIYRGLVGKVFANGQGDRGSIPGRVIPKTLKIVLDTSLLNTQHYKVRIKGKVEQSMEME